MYLAEDRDQHLNNLKERLLDRKYPEKIVNDKIKRATINDRRVLILKQRKPMNKSDKKVQLIFTHNKVNPDIQMCVCECKKLVCKKVRAKYSCTMHM